MNILFYKEYKFDFQVIIQIVEFTLMVALSVLIPFVPDIYSRTLLTAGYTRIIKNRDIQRILHSMTVNTYLYLSTCYLLFYRH